MDVSPPAACWTGEACWPIAQRGWLVVGRGWHAGEDGMVPTPAVVRQLDSVRAGMHPSEVPALQVLFEVQPQSSPPRRLAGRRERAQPRVRPCAFPRFRSMLFGGGRRCRWTEITAVGFTSASGASSGCPTGRGSILRRRLQTTWRRRPGAGLLGTSGQPFAKCCHAA